MLFTPKAMNMMIGQHKRFRQVLVLFVLLFSYSQSFAVAPANAHLDKMPAELEHDYALSALPLDLRSGASVYLLDPTKGYYLAHRGSNGFVAFVARTEWEWPEFRQDVIAPISFDAEGAKMIFPVYEAVAAMRASGKYTALQIRDIIIDRIRKGVYKAPKSGISYMLAPIMRWYVGPPDKYTVATMNMPHYMPYAPYLTNEDVCNITRGHAGSPFVGNAAPLALGTKNNPFVYLIIPLGEKETAKVVQDNKALLKRLAACLPYLK